MALVDSHAHLDFEHYAAEKRARVIERARSAGVTHCVLIGLWRMGKRLDACRETLEAAAADPAFLTATAGIHPHEAAPGERDLDGLAALAGDGRVHAVGECGLDYHYDHSPRDVQRRVFEKQIALSLQLSKPLVVHTREADADTAAALRSAPGARGVIHCFTSDAAAARAYLDLGFSISFSGVVTFKNADALRTAAALVPLDRLLVETDCPFLAPVPHRGRANEPGYVVHTLERLAALKGVSPAELAARTAENARALFDLPPASVAAGPSPVCPDCMLEHPPTGGTS